MCIAGMHKYPTEVEQDLNIGPAVAIHFVGIIPFIPLISLQSKFFTRACDIRAQIQTKKRRVCMIDSNRGKLCYRAQISKANGNSKKTEIYVRKLRNCPIIGTDSDNQKEARDSSGHKRAAQTSGSTSKILDKCLNHVGSES